MCCQPLRRSVLAIQTQVCFAVTYKTLVKREREGKKGGVFISPVCAEASGRSCRPPYSSHNYPGAS